MAETKVNQLVLKGIMDGGRAFTGPGIVQIDLTGKCNNNCIGCWVHSPFIKNPPRDKNLSLPFAKVKTLIEDLSRLGTEGIYLSGAGEPFLHSDIIEIIELIKMKGLKLNIITNFTLIDEGRAKRLIDLGVDMITASIWAATPEAYIKTHPGKTEVDFYKIKDGLKRLSRLKTKGNKYLPHIKIYNVICNLNYKEIQQMIDFALDTQAESIEFQIMDIIKDETSFLVLSDQQVKDIKEQFDALTKDRDLYFKELGLSDFKTQKVTKDKELREFPGRFIRIYPNFFLKEWLKDEDGVEKKAMHSLRCPEGFSTLPTKVNPLINEVDNKVTFKFFKEDCKKCPQFKNLCLVGENSKITFNFLTILGFGSFMRRLNSANIYEQVYEKDIIDNLPCYMGWTYSRVLSTGEVIPCCKAVFKPLGNIYKNNFLEIWDSPAYREFRYKAKSLPKSDPYFKEINCYKSCDNAGMNLQIKESFFSDKKGKGLNHQLTTKRKEKGDYSLPEAQIKLIIPASKFKSGNLNIQEHIFGKGMVIDGGEGFCFAEYKVYLPESKRYVLWSRYASGEKRPVNIYLDGGLLKEDGMSEVTGGWRRKNLRTFKEAIFFAGQGEHILRIYTNGVIPHLERFMLVEFDNKMLIPDREEIYRNRRFLGFFRDKVSLFGGLIAGRKILRFAKPSRLKENFLEILGIYDGEYAYRGPFHVQIDLTNNCNNNCIGCWCNSPLLEEKGLSQEEKREELPLEIVKEVIDEIVKLGGGEIYFSGGGEPFMHPDIMEILKFTKSRGLVCYVNTNFTLLNKKRIDELIKIGVEHLTVSTWAGTAHTYDITHPNKNEETFRQIVENLRYLNRSKRETPYIKLYNVLFTMNYQEVEEMIELARYTGSESAEFTLIDTMPGKTDKLALDTGAALELQRICQRVAQRMDAHGFIDNVLLFRFDSFLRRISSSQDLQKATYDRNIIDKMPCYIGWLFARVMPNGGINSCLKSHRVPVGNLYRDNFNSIWNNSKQRYFRSKAKVYKKDDPFFRLIGNDPDTQEAGCYKSCDDIGRNMHMHKKMMSLGPLERTGFTKAAKLARALRRLKSEDKHKSVSLKKASKEDLVISGITDGRRAFKGPEHIVVDLTNRCNQRCIGCWMYSPLLKEENRGFNQEWLRIQLDTEVVKRLVDELADLGAERIRYTGGGEPFMHPDIMELLEYTKKRGIKTAVTTNFSLMDKEKIKQLVDLELDELAVSLWAARDETYQATHPGVKQGLFEEIVKNLVYLAQTKKNSKPCLTLSNVITNLNCQDIPAMYKLAQDVKAENLYYTVVDVIEGATDSLILNQARSKEVLKLAKQIESQNRASANGLNLDYFNGFLERVSGDSSYKGNYDVHRVDFIPCYVGWFFCRIMADGTVVPCCRAVKEPMGNINKENFKDIWFSKKYDEFRCRAKTLSKTHPYFKEIGCIKTCDNLMHNEKMHQRLKAWI